MYVLVGQISFCLKKELVKLKIEKNTFVKNGLFNTKKEIFC